MNYSSINSIEGQYDLIYTDPPWKQTRGGAKAVRPNQIRPFDYNLMDLVDIESLHSKVLSKHTAPVHNVFLWTIDKYLHESEQMMKRLGYTLHARMIWDKVTGIPAAYTVRFAHEYLLWFYIKGKMLKPCDEMRGKYTTVFREQVKKHSQKPSCAYEMLESMFPKARKLELFARRSRTGWDSFGDEIA